VRIRPDLAGATLRGSTCVGKQTLLRWLPDDLLGGTSPEAHRAGLERIVAAGAQPITWVSLACEHQRDWARTETVADVVDIVLTSRLRKGL
jgi:hypothetical protein